MLGMISASVCSDMCIMGVICISIAMIVVKVGEMHDFIYYAFQSRIHITSTGKAKISICVLPE